MSPSKDDGKHQREQEEEYVDEEETVEGEGENNDQDGQSGDSGVGQETDEQDTQDDDKEAERSSSGDDGEEIEVHRDDEDDEQEEVGEDENDGGDDDDDDEEMEKDGQKIDDGRGTKHGMTSQRHSNPNKRQKVDNDEDDDYKNENEKDKNSAASSTDASSSRPPHPKNDVAQKNKKANGGNKVGSKHDEALDPDMRGSVDRLPKKGQKVQWKALPGYVDGEVVEILTAEKEVEGKSVRATDADPRIVLKSSKSGKVCVHKPEAVYF